MRLRVLLTNFALATRSGSELYLQDVASGLLARGHQPIAFAPVLGRLAETLRDATIPVVDDLRKLSVPPDVIHGQHNHELITALLQFPGVPAVRVCHGWADAPVQTFPRIYRYVAVDDTVASRMLSEWGVPAERMRVMLNFVDVSRFAPRGPLPPRPARALVFSNDAGAHLPIIERACAPLGIAVDALGASVGAVAADPARHLRDYDLVFAKARCAIEAMAIGTAVIVCDYAGIGPLVTTRNFDGLRRLNFGVRTLSEPLSTAAVAREIDGYDAADAAAVSHRIRREARLDLAVDDWIDMYTEVIAEHRRAPVGSYDDEMRAAAAYLATLRPPGTRDHAYRLLRDLYFRCERSALVRTLLPSRTKARRLARRLRSS
jgi:hypothetical protein